MHKVRRLRAGLPDDYISGNGSWVELDKWVELDWNDSKSVGMIDIWIYYLQVGRRGGSSQAMPTLYLTLEVGVA